MTDALARLEAANAALERRDALLQEELQEARDQARVIPEGLGAAEAVEVDGERIPFERFAQETIVRKTGRPVLAIIRNQARLELEEPDSRIWKQRLQLATDALVRAASAIGRIEVQGHSLGWLGTGWLVAPDIIVTNRHVAAEFGRRRGGDFVFRQGIAGAAMAASIDFLEEQERRDSLSFALSEILHIEDDDGPDLAFLRVGAAGKHTLAKPIALSAATAQIDETVAVIGYPARDSRIPDADLMDKIYGNTYDTKRLAPGQILRASRQQVQHDCTTLGGNSGSAIISLGTGDAVGLHFAGTFLTANYAVPSLVVQERLDQVLRPTKTQPKTPAPAPHTDRVSDAPLSPLPVVPVGSSGSASFNLPMRVTVEIGAPVAGSGGPASVTPPPPAGDADEDPERDQAPSPPAAATVRAERIPWSAGIFSVALSDALGRHDFKAIDRLIAAFEHYATSRSYIHAAQYATRDLTALRRKRQFVLMRRYAEAAIASGTDNMQVKRQYGQALIEVGELEVARTILQEVVARGDVNREEEFEALGLIGRSHKQEYVEDPAAADSGERLQRAVEAYRSVYDREPSMIWHGINVASCTVRAQRDGLPWAQTPHALQIAGAVLDVIRAREDKAGERHQLLDVWDHATRVEALVILNRLTEAEASLGHYLAHPDMDAFEVSSTYRQFTQVLQLDAATPIMQRLSEAVARFRGGGALHGGAEARATAAVSIQQPLVSVLLRVSNPNWQPPSRPDLVIHSRTGNVITAEASRDSLRELLKDPAVFSVEESRPGGTTDCVHSVPFINVKADYAGPSGTRYTERGDQALIAVIDDGIDIHHEAFLGSNGASRIVGIWDQTKEGAPPPGFTFGTYYDAATIAAAVRSTTVLAIGRNAGGHGTHVASIAAGARCGTFGGGVAPEASLLVVITDNKSSIGYSRGHSDALSFIDAEATRLGLPVVVNVSQGMNAGAHDGKSPLEARFNTFCTAAPGRVVVKSAGNEGSNQGHAKFSVGQDVVSSLQWRRAQGAQWPREHIELWWRYGNELEFRLGSPSGLWSTWVTLGAPSASGRFASAGGRGTDYRLELVKSHPDQGDGLLRIELLSDSQIQSGTWQLEVKGRRVKRDATIHAWIERGDPMPSQFTTFVSGDVTLSVPGTAEYVITVGAIDAADGIRLLPFSSLGPTRDDRPKPDVVAPGKQIFAARGGTAAGDVPMDGTSMAAPHVAGAIALALSKGKKAGVVATAAQVAVALQQNTLNYSSRWDPAQGYGVIDVTALLAAL